jgi:hypothetical protein
MHILPIALIAAIVTASTPALAQSNALTRAYVYEVNSAAAGNEKVAGRSNTMKDHGGAWMRIVTEEIGYGGNAQAQLLSNSLREIGKEPLCRAGAGLGKCRRGDTIVGYRRTWDASGHQGGNFEFVVYPAGSGSAQRVAFQVL